MLNRILGDTMRKGLAFETGHALRRDCGDARRADFLAMATDMLVVIEQQSETFGGFRPWRYPAGIS
jgi:hypothetical protein